MDTEELKTSEHEKVPEELTKTIAKLRTTERRPFKDLLQTDISPVLRGEIPLDVADRKWLKASHCDMGRSQLHVIGSWLSNLATRYKLKGRKIMFACKACHTIFIGGKPDEEDKHMPSVRFAKDSRMSGFDGFGPITAYRCIFELSKEAGYYLKYRNEGYVKAPLVLRGTRQKQGNVKFKVNMICPTHVREVNNQIDDLAFVVETFNAKAGKLGMEIIDKYAILT